MLIQILLLVSLTFYVTLGYIAVPVLFKMLPSFQAGEIAGVYLGIAHWQMVIMALLAWGLATKDYAKQVSVKVSSWRLHLHFLFILLAEGMQLFKLSPAMQALKQQALQQTGQPLSHDSPLWHSFAQLHGLSQVLYLLSCLLVLKLLLFLSKTKAQV